MPDLRRAVHACLCLLELSRRFAFDQVAGDRERGPGETDHRLIGAQRLANEANGLERPGHRLLRLGNGETLDVGDRPYGLRNNRAHVLDQLDLDPHAENGKHDVGEHHRRIHAVATDRLQRDLRAQLRLARDVEESVALPELAILGK